MGNAGRAFSIHTPVDMFREVEKRLHYRFWDKERERSNYAKGRAEGGVARWRCPHQRIAWSGPPHDTIRAYVCLDCHGAACEPEIKDRGFTFETIPDYEMDVIFDLDLERQARGKRAAITYR